MLRRCNPLISFRCWGAFEEVFSDRLKSRYQNGETNIAFDDPSLGLEVISELLDPNYEFYNLSYYGEDPESFDDEDIEDFT